jgi:hypothetical protein
MRVPRHRNKGTKRTHERVDHKLEVQVVADGAQNKVGHKLVEGSIRVMDHPDQKYIVNRAGEHFHVWRRRDI